MNTTTEYYTDGTHDTLFYTRSTILKNGTALLRGLGITSVETVCRILEMSQLAPYSIKFRWYFAQLFHIYNPSGYYYLAKSLLRTGRTAEALQMFVIARSLVRDSLESESDKNMRLVDKIDRIIQGFDRRDPFYVFPTEILHEILNYLSWEDCTQCQMVSRRWYQYCNDDVSLWRTTIDFSEYPYDDVVLFRRRLQYAAEIRPEIAHVHLAGKKMRCLALLKVANFQFGNTRIGKLTIHLGAKGREVPFSSEYFRDLVVVRELEICLENDNPLSLHSILQNQPMLEVLRLCAGVVPGNMNDILQFSLKRVQIRARTRLRPERGILDVLLETCPNLEFLDVSYGKETSRYTLFPIEPLGRALYQSKLIFLALCGYRFERQITDPEENPIFTPFWPQNLTSLVMDNSSWSALEMGSGSLQNLQHLKIGGGINVNRFFKKFAVGKSLTLLHLYSKKGDLEELTPINIWGKCPLLRFVSFLEFRFQVDRCIEGLILHCPKLEVIDVIGMHISNTTIVALNNKKGLQRIGFVQCPLELESKRCKCCMHTRTTEQNRGMLYTLYSCTARFCTSRIEQRCTRVAISWESVVPQINF